MKEATIIYPHQLFLEHPGLHTDRPVFLVEEPLLLTEFPIHSQKLMLHRLSLQAYSKTLSAQGYQVHYISCHDVENTAGVFEIIAAAGIKALHIMDTTDTWLEQRIVAAASTHTFTLQRYESLLFILPKAEAVSRYQISKKHLASFYKQLRKDRKILVDKTGEPFGGKWSFDTDNRNKVPQHTTLPTDIMLYDNNDTKAAKAWLKQVKAEQYGSVGCWLPYNHQDAAGYLETFLTERFVEFGTYEDAISTESARLWHSTLSPLLNIGLLSPQQVLDRALVFATKTEVPLNSLEGFVRQILGWREFIRASYEADGTMMRTRNFWRHTRALPPSFWTGTTGIMPIDTAIKNALAFGYNHHIERLMVLGNFMLLSQTNPNAVYRWFMAMYVDAYDWVMVPNVYGMSQFSDGGIFATKPYISGSNYVRKMSDYSKGEWEEIWTALYWNFIATHADFFRSNYRLSMMPRLLEKMGPEKKSGYTKIVKKYFKKDN